MKCKFNEGSNFVRDGQTIMAKYLGEFWVCGQVQSSRVKYGAMVQHTVISSSPTYVNNELRNTGSTFLIDENCVTEAKQGV